MPGEVTKVESARAEIRVRFPVAALASQAPLHCPHPFIRAASPDGRCVVCEAARETPSTFLDSPAERIVYEAEDPGAMLMLIEQEEQRRIEKRSRESLAYFVRASWNVLEPGTPLLWNWHMEAVALHVQAVMEGWARSKADPSYVAPIQNLMINVPPGTAKSRIVSVCAVAWAWLHWPSLRLLCLSVNPDVATRDSMLCRELLGSEWYRRTFTPSWTFADDQNAKRYFKNTAGGWRKAAGATATIVGDRADGLLIDDPNDPKDVSDVALKSVTFNYDTSIGNRLNDLRISFRIGIQQRVHELDFTAHVMKTGDWHHLCLPMEFDPARRCRTAIGFEDPRTEEYELLHAERFPPKVLAAEKRRLGSYGYAAQMNQSPAPAEGGMFKKAWWKYYDPSDMPKLDQLIISVDASFKKTDTGSRVCLMVIGRSRANSYRYVVEIINRTMGYVETIEELLSLRKKYPALSAIIIEDKANGSAAIDTLKTLGVTGVIEIEPDGGKESRAFAATPIVEAGDVLLPKGAPWLEDFIHELSVFPMGAHDDQVDALSQALSYLRGSVASIRAQWMGGK